MLLHVETEKFIQEGVTLNDQSIIIHNGLRKRENYFIRIRRIRHHPNRNKRKRCKKHERMVRYAASKKEKLKRGDMK